MTTAPAAGLPPDDPGFADAYFDQPLPKLEQPFPNGWMSPLDLQVLYNAALRATGPVLEVGPWLGRSTTALAAGLRDREAAGAAPVEFDTIDFGITSVDEWSARFGERLRPDKDNGRAIEAVYHPGGTIAVLIRNLKGLGLLPWVTNVVRGDFLTCPFTRRYGLIFCDATHDDDEIARHVPRLAELARPGCTFVFDDVITEERASKVCAHLAATRRFMTRTLYPSRKRRCKLLVVETH